MTNLLSHLLAYGMPYGSTWIVIAVIALVLFGGKKLPEVGKGIGGAIKNFKLGLKSGEEEVTKVEEHPSVNQPHLPGPVAGASQPAFKFDPHTGQPLAPEAPPAAKFDPYTGKPLGRTEMVSSARPLLESRT